MSQTQVIAPAVIVTEIKSDNNGSEEPCMKKNEDKLLLLEEYGFNNKALNVRILNRFYRSENDWGRVIDILCHKTARFGNRLQFNHHHNHHNHHHHGKDWKLVKLEKKLLCNQKKAKHLAVKIEILTERIEKIKQVKDTQESKWNNGRHWSRNDKKYEEGIERKHCKRTDKGICKSDQKERIKCCRSDKEAWKAEKEERIKAWKAEKEARKIEDHEGKERIKCCRSDKDAWKAEKKERIRAWKLEKEERIKAWKAEKEARKIEDHEGTCNSDRKGGIKCCRSDKDAWKAEKEERIKDWKAAKEARKIEKESRKAEKKDEMDARRAEKKAKCGERFARKKCCS